MKEAISGGDVLQTPETPNDKIHNADPRSYFDSINAKQSYGVHVSEDDETKHTSPSNNMFVDSQGHGDNNHDDPKRIQWKQQMSLLSPLATLLKNKPGSENAGNLGINVLLNPIRRQSKISFPCTQPKPVDVFDLMEPALDNSQLPLANVAVRILRVKQIDESET